MKKDRDYSTAVKVACVAESSKFNNGRHASYPNQMGRTVGYGSRVYVAKANSGCELVSNKSSARGKRHRNDFRLVVLQAKQKPRVLHRNKRYVVPLKDRHKTIDVLTQRPLQGNRGLLVVLQAKQKPRVLHRNKRYVVPLKDRHKTIDVLTQRPTCIQGNTGLGEGSGPVRVCSTCVFSLAPALFVPIDKRVRL